MSSIVVRNMRPEDMISVEALEKELFCDAWTGSSLADTFRYHSETSFVAEADGMVVGYLFFMKAADEGELLRIGVSGAHRRKGIAQALMGHMDTYAAANEIHCVWLEVREHNEAARALYEKCGFTMQGYRRKYYHHPDEDAIIMCKKW